MSELKDSWLIDGDCKTCRRKEYCNTHCKKYKESLANLLVDCFFQTDAGKAMSVVGDTLDRVDPERAEREGTWKELCIKDIIDIL